MCISESLLLIACEGRSAYTNWKGSNTSWYRSHDFSISGPEGVSQIFVVCATSWALSCSYQLHRTAHAASIRLPS